MIYVIASILVKAGRISEYLEIMKSNVPRVREESGCIAYTPTVDKDAGLPQQRLDENVVTIIEKWESPKALYDHFKAPHMVDYLERVEDMVEDVSIKVLREA